MRRNEAMDKLFQEIIKLESIDECYRFFDDLCTFKELEAFAQRIEAAKLILQGKTYEQIIKETSISSATLSRVSRCIKYGDGGYEEVINKSAKSVNKK